MIVRNLKLAKIHVLRPNVLPLTRGNRMRKGNKLGTPAARLPSGAAGELGGLVTLAPLLPLEVAAHCSSPLRRKLQQAPRENVPLLSGYLTPDLV